MIPCVIFALVTLLNASIMQCTKIDEEMTDEEIANFFHTTRDDIPEYDVVTVRHNLYKQGSSNLQLEFTAFGEQIHDFLEPSNDALASTNTPVWIAYMHSNGTIVHQRLREDIIGLVDTFFRYGVNSSSIVAISPIDENRTASFEGTVHGMIIRSLPERFRKTLKSRRETESPKQSRTLVETHQHVIIKSSSPINETETLPNSGREIFDTEISSNATHSKSTRSTQDTVYVSILVTTDYYQAQMPINDWVLYDEIIYQLAFWNAVDLRFRAVDNPKVRIHIAGIVIGLDRKATPHLNKYRSENEIIFSHKYSDMMNYWSTMKKPLAFRGVTYDLVVTLTDNDLVTAPRRIFSKRLLGIASFATLCSSNVFMMEPYAVVHDKGAFVGVLTAAHELGHILGVHHDGQIRSDDDPEDKCNEQHGYIMEATRFSAPTNLKWSRCSLSRFSRFLRRREVNCVDEPNNLPNPRETPGPPVQTILPGDIADTHKQCQAQGYSWACKTDPGICSSLRCYNTWWNLFYGGWWCEHAAPAIDGTRCAADSKCLDGVCQCFTVECIFKKKQSPV